MNVYFYWDNLVLTALQAACVLLPAAGLPLFLERFRRGWWVLVLPLSIVVTIGVIELFPASTSVYTWAALLLVPPGCALALGWAMHGARPPLALLAVPLLALVWIWPHEWTGELGGDVLIAGSAITLGRLLGRSAPLPLLKLGLVAMAVVDAILVFSGSLEAPADALNAAIPAAGLPQLQSGAFSGYGLGYGDFLAAAVLGGILAVEKGPQVWLAIAVFVVSLAWDQLFLVTDILPATVPPALVLVAWEGFNRPMLRRRLAPPAVLTIAFLVAAANAQAAAGGGSSGFGGGGGGGFGGGGGGFSSGGGRGGGSPIVGLFIVAGIILFLLYAFISAWRLEKKRKARLRQIELAAAEAAEDDAAFAHDRVTGDAKQLFLAIQAAWDARDRDELGRLIGADLHTEWVRRLDDFERKGWHNRVKPHNEPEVEYSGMVNRTDDADDRVVVRIKCTLDDYVETRTGGRVQRNKANTEISKLCEWWTLQKRDEKWRLLSIEQDAEGVHNLDSEIIASPWGDDERLTQEAVAERAAAEAAPAGVAPSELADLDFAGPARAAAMDLALADGRFDVDFVEASVRRAVEAWAEAVDGADTALEATARPEVIGDLLYPGDPSRKTRLVVRGPHIDRVTIAALDVATMPSLTVEIQVTGRRYIEDRDTAAVISGSQSSATTFTERWVLTLDGEGEWPWRIASTTASAQA